MIHENTKSLTRYGHGFRALTHKGKIVTTSVGSTMDHLAANVQTLETKHGRVPAQYANRPDLISNLFYGTPGYWWYLMQVNGVTDPYEGFNSGDQILIPILV